MANTAQARKRARQNTVRRGHNIGQRSLFRTYVKKVLKAIAAGDKAKAQTEFSGAESVLDRIADKGIVHKNKSARLKSRLSAKVKALALAAPAA